MGISVRDNLTTLHIGRIDLCLPTRTAEPFGVYEVMQDDMPGYSFNGVIWSPALEAYILEPDVFAIAQMRYKVEHFSANCPIRECTPQAWEVPGPDGEPLGSSIELYEHHADTLRTVDYKGFLPADPLIAFRMMRPAMPPAGQTSAPTYTLTWGNGHRLTWGWHRIVKYDHAVTGYVQEVPIPEGERENITVGESITWEIWHVGGDLIISTGGLVITVPRVGTTHPAPWGFRTNCGAAVIKLIPMKFATSGSIVTPWFNIGADLEESASTSMLDALPLGQTETGVMPNPVTIGVEKRNGIERRYTFTLAGDGYHTPRLSAWRAHYDGVDSIPDYGTVDWLHIGGYLKGLTERQQINSPNNATIALAQRTRAEELTLRQALQAHDSTLLQGSVAIKYEFGYRTEEGEEFSERLIGAVDGFGDKLDETRLNDVSYDAFSLLSRWETEVFNPPCLLGLEPGEAVALLLHYAGIPRESIINMAGGWGDYIADPGRGYASAPWLMQDGVRVCEMIRQLCDTYQLVVWEDGRGQVTINARPYRAGDIPDWVFSNSAEAEREGSFGSIEAIKDYAGLINHMEMRGQDAYGKPIIAALRDKLSIETPGTPAYVGRVRRHVEVNADLQTKAAVNIAAISKWQHGRPQAHPSYNVNEPGYWMWKVHPYSLLRYHQADSEGWITNRDMLVMSLSNNFNPDRDKLIAGSAQAEEIDYEEAV